MAEYIGREALINIIKERNGRVPGWIKECISECPEVADVRPERYGHWERTASMEILDKHYIYYHCSICWRRVKSEDEIEFEYCPFCGAKMDGEDE